MDLFGFALLPDKRTQEEIIAFQQSHARFIGGPKLGTEINIPHMSITQHPFYKGVDYKRYLELLNEPVDGTWGILFYQPVGWIFAQILEVDRFKTIHNLFFNNTQQHIDVKSIDISEDLSGLSRLEIENHMRYGYRYTGKAYLPHITFGRTHDSAHYVSSAAREDFVKQFEGRHFLFDRVVFYEAGPFGALEKVLAEKQL